MQRSNSHTGCPSGWCNKLFVHFMSHGRQKCWKSIKWGQHNDRASSCWKRSETQLFNIKGEPRRIIGGWELFRIMKEKYKKVIMVIMFQGPRGHSNVKPTRWRKNGSTTFPWQRGTVILVKALEKLLHECYAATTALSSILNEPVCAHVSRMILCEDKDYFCIAERILVRLDAVMGGTQRAAW